MLGKGLINLLDELGLISNGAVYFTDKSNGNKFNFPSETEKKITQINPDAYYVFNKQPYILFFDLENNINTLREDEIHKQVWSFDYSPLIFISKTTETHVYNAFSFSKKSCRLQEIKISSEKRKEVFSFWNLQSGQTWQWLQETYYAAIQKKRVNQKLFENIRSVREILTNRSSIEFISDDNANILILRLIFIRYLIDRDVKIDPHYINGSTILERRKSFSELVKTPALLDQFFTFLNEKFNGVLFKNNQIELSPRHCDFLSEIFNTHYQLVVPELFDNSDFYFDIFDFSIIPVEVISGIYESLISPETKKLHSAVYTPAFLVDYILTETVDKYLNTNQTSECKIFDPSCGSGIFLVQSYRRMVDKEISISGGKILKTRLRDIAEKNLFGIDINEQALKISCFSIYIALLDYQDPKTILDNFQFPQFIGKNLFVADFFEQDLQHPLNTVIKNSEFHFILGNPPWKKDSSKAHLAWVNTAGVYSKKVKGKIEIAQSFLLRSRDFMSPKTVSSLIVTSMAFYNVSSTTKEFKQSFLTSCQIDRFLDLSPVRKLIFEEKISPASIVYYRLSNNGNHFNNIVKHTSIKSNIFLKYFKTLVIEKFDQKEIQQKHFIENDWMFKVALYGNTLDFVFIKRLEKTNLRILDMFDGKTLFKGAGIHKGTKEKYKSFPIIGKEIIENDDVEKYLSRSSARVKIKDEDSYIKSGREAGLYEGMQILIKEQAKNESEIVISLTDQIYVFRSGVFSLSTTTRQNDLQYLYSIFISRLYEYYIFITSGSWGVSTRPQIRLDDEYLAFPLINANKEIKEELLSLVNAFIQPYIDHFNSFHLGTPLFNETAYEQINKKINELYGVRTIDHDLIDYVLNVSRYQFQESKLQLCQKKIDFHPEYLEAYTDIFLKELKQYYKNEYVQAQIYSLNYFVAVNFVFLKDKPAKMTIRMDKDSDEGTVLSAISNSLSIAQLTSSGSPEKNLYVQKDIKGFESNSFFIIKPNEAKCWHRLMAWYDLAEIKQAIENAEIDQLNQREDVT